MSKVSSEATVYSYAKVNLALDVLEKRPDGYHAIESVMQTISVHDTIVLCVGGEYGIRVSTNAPGIPTGPKNLAYKAALLILEKMGDAPGIDIHIEKRIPTEAGLGGGSSNAAAVLRGLAEVLKLTITQEELCELAGRIGSDVPFFLVGGTALVRGRGEIVRPVEDIPTRWLLIIKPPFGISTAWAYRRLDEMGVECGSMGVWECGSEHPTASERILKCVEEGSLNLWQLLDNDLETPAIERHPEIDTIKRSLIDVGAEGALMCGSGSAVFGLFDSEDGARCAASQITGEVFTARTISRQDYMKVLSDEHD